MSSPQSFPTRHHFCSLNKENGILVPATKYIFDLNRKEFQPTATHIFFRYGASSRKAGGMRFCFKVEEVVTVYPQESTNDKSPTLAASLIDERQKGQQHQQGDLHTDEFDFCDCAARSSTPPNEEDKNHSQNDDVPDPNQTDAGTAITTTVPMVAKVFQKTINNVVDADYFNEAMAQCMCVDFANNFNKNKDIKKKVYFLSCHVVVISLEAMAEAKIKLKRTLDQLAQCFNRIQEKLKKGYFSSQPSVLFSKGENGSEPTFISKKTQMENYLQTLREVYDATKPTLDVFKFCTEDSHCCLFAMEPLMRGAFIKYNSNFGGLFNTVKDLNSKKHDKLAGRRPNANGAEDSDDGDDWTVGGITESVVVRNNGEGSVNLIPIPLSSSPTYTEEESAAAQSGAEAAAYKADGGRNEGGTMGSNVAPLPPKIKKPTAEEHLLALNTAEAFSHFTLVESDHDMLVCDLQGVGDLFTDPQIHTINGKGLGMGNMGEQGIGKWVVTHKCNDVCRQIGLGTLIPCRDGEASVAASAHYGSVHDHTQGAGLKGRGLLSRFFGKKSDERLKADGAPPENNNGVGASDNNNDEYQTRRLIELAEAESPLERREGESKEQYLARINAMTDEERMNAAIARSLRVQQNKTYDSSGKPIFF